jgi:hypothetical protein
MHFILYQISSKDSAYKSSAKNASYEGYRKAQANVIYTQEVKSKCYKRMQAVRSSDRQLLRSERIKPKPLTCRVLAQRLLALRAKYPVYQ